MSKQGSRDGAPAGRPKRKSLFTLSSLTQIHRDEAQQDQPTKTLQKRRTPSLSTAIDHPDMPPSDVKSPPSLHSSPIKGRRPSLSIRPTLHRPGSSVFGSLRSMRSNGEEETPVSSTSSKAPSVNWGETESIAGNGRNVLHHGEVQTSSSMFRKKKEYLVLTDIYLFRCKSQAKASEIFSSIPPPFGRSPTVRHSSGHSIGSTHDLQSLGSESSGEKEGRINLRQVVAVHKLDDGKPYFAMEVCSLDEDSNQASAMTLQFGNPEDRDLWLRSIRSIANGLRLQGPGPIMAYNASYAARTVERENDYDPAHFAMYKIVQRQTSKSSSRSSTDDLSKIASVVCFLAIGFHKVHLIPLKKSSSRTSSPSLAQNSHGSFGILTLTSIRMKGLDDTFELTFRSPLKRPITLYLASLASNDIALRLHHIENYLRPECAQHLFKFSVPPELEDRVLPLVSSEDEEYCCLDRTLTAYCVAYDVNPALLRYTINYSCEDAPRFELLPISDSRRGQYNATELLAVMRALRYNESFGSISFADIYLDSLNGLHDHFGSEFVCSKTKRGTPIRLTASQLGRSCLLVQEVRALAATSKKLRRLDFSGCITAQPPGTTDDGEPRAQDLGCGIVEALFPLCKHQTTNVDWISLSGITLSDADLDYLVGAVVDRACHFRALELSRCGLNDRSLGLILDALRAQDNTLEALDISGNAARLSPAVFDSQISVFGFIRRLNLSHLSRTSGPEPLLTSDTLLTWRLEELRLSGTNVNEKTVEALAMYLQSPQSDTLHELFLDQAYLSGSDVATLMRAMHRQPDKARNLHLNISHNNITKNYDELVKAIEDNHSPTHLTLRNMEYRDETVLRHLINALRVNHSTVFLDFSRAALPADASEDTSLALERLFAENDTLEELDISGEDSRLEVSKFGAGLNRALSGLRRNKRLHILHIQFQKLGVPGASILADVLKENDTLREIHCENNDIPLSAFTDLVNALFKNTTLVYLPTMQEGRATALRQTERQIKQIRDDNSMSPQTPVSPTSRNPSSFGVRRSLASVKRNVSRSTSAYTPSFPSLPPANRATSSPLNANSTFSFGTSPTRTKLNTSSSVTAPLPQLSDQDVQAALRLVTESWDRQQYRLQQYLYRNWCILQGVETSMEIMEEDFERPASIGDLSKVLEKVKIDSTPTAEKELDFGPVFSPDFSSVGSPEFLDEEVGLGSPSMRGGLRGGGMEEAHIDDVVSPVDEEGEVLELGLGIRGNDEPRTPTQARFIS